MNDTILAYLVSLGIVFAGALWVVAGGSSALCLAIGIATIVVGLISLVSELRR